MNRILVHIALLFLTLWVFSCREVYYPEDIESDELIPVIQGKIMNNEPPEVKIYWALKYTDGLQQFISEADVYIWDDYGYSVQLFESSPGTYIDYGLYGIPGHTYTLKVILPDGREYESIPQLLRDAPGIDSVYADPGKRTSYTYSSTGKPVLNEEVGLYILSDLSEPSSQTAYYRFNTRVVKESVYTVDVGSPSSHSIFLWETKTMDYSYSVDYSASQDFRQVLYKHPLGFLRYYYDPSLETPTTTAPFTEAWIVTHNVYSISADVFQYYNSMGRQLNAYNQIFAPVASQVKSNIYCKSDPAGKIIGVFEASARSTVYKAFGWKNIISYRSKVLPWFPEVGTGSQEWFPPDFWVLF